VSRRLASDVYVGGVRWPAGSTPPPEVANAITNPKAWAGGRPVGGRIAGPGPGDQVRAFVGRGHAAWHPDATDAEDGGDGTDDGTESFGPGRQGFDHPGALKIIDGDALPDGPSEPPRSGRGSSRAAWSFYADTIGATYPPDATREHIIAAVDAARQ
jgi:hypothetical protein